MEARAPVSRCFSKPYIFIGFGGIHGPKPYKFIGFGGKLLTLRGTSDDTAYEQKKPQQNMRRIRAKVREWERHPPSRSQATGALNRALGICNNGSSRSRKSPVFYLNGPDRLPNLSKKVEGFVLHLFGGAWRPIGFASTQKIDEFRLRPKPRLQMPKYPG